jgi:TonB family protein
MSVIRAARAIAAWIWPAVSVLGLITGLDGCAHAAERPAKILREPGIVKARSLWERDACEELLALIRTQKDSWTLYRTDAANLNLHTATCLERLGRKQEATAVLQAVLREDPGSGFAEEARARLDGHEWTSPKVKRVSLAARYPKNEGREGTEGLVYVRLTLDPEGKLTSYHVIEATSEAFAAAAVVMLLHASFEPARMDGRAVAAHYDIAIGFRLRSFRVN